MIDLALLCEPHSQGRPRMAVIGGHPRAYDPPASKRWKVAAREALVEILEGLGIKLPLFPSGPVEAKILAVFGLPSSRARKRKPVAEDWMDGKPDFDNIAKAVCDAATSVLWKDDSQVVMNTVKKIRAPQGERPFVGIRVDPAGPLKDHWEAAKAFLQAAITAEVMP